MQNVSTAQAHMLNYVAQKEKKKKKDIASWLMDFVL